MCRGAQRPQHRYAALEPVCLRNQLRQKLMDYDATGAKGFVLWLLHNHNRLGSDAAAGCWLSDCGRALPVRHRRIAGLMIVR